MIIRVCLQRPARSRRAFRGCKGQKRLMPSLESGEANVVYRKHVQQTRSPCRARKETTCRRTGTLARATERRSSKLRRKRKTHEMTSHNSAPRARAATERPYRSRTPPSLGSERCGFEQRRATNKSVLSRRLRALIQSMSILYPLIPVTFDVTVSFMPSKRSRSANLRIRSKFSRISEYAR